MLTLAGNLALWFGDVGIYALFAYLTSARAQEISIDMVFAGEMGRLFRMVMARSVKLMLAGFPLGFAIAIVLIRVAPSEFPLRRNPGNPMFLGLALLLGVMPLGTYYLVVQCRNSSVSEKNGNI